jgi:hypothetical protein
MRSPVAVAVMGAFGLVAILGACSSDGGTDAVTDTSSSAAGRTLLALPDSRPGDVIALRAGDDGTTIEWIDRRAGTIRSVAVPAETSRSLSGPLSRDDIETLATIEVGIEGEQRGLLGHTVIEGVRYAAWTDPDTLDLIVGEVGPDGVERIVWDGGGTAGGAVGGHLEAGADGQLILGIGQLTDWATSNSSGANNSGANGSGANGGGALVQLDPAGPADQEPVILSDGYTNPFAFAVVDGELWVADNAVGDDVERIGRADLADRDDLTATGRDPRAPSALIALGGEGPNPVRLAVCGFLDGQLLPWTPGASTGTSGYGPSLGPCRTGAAVLADGTIVTATDDGLVLLTN